VEDIIDYAMSKDIPYFAINFTIDNCEDCGYSGDMLDTCPV
jgi:ribonucleoside-triphosphate reductase